jgi:hypothetical protein
MAKCHWIIQSNGGEAEEYEKLTKELANIGVHCTPFAFTSFSADLPEVDHSGPVICRGSIEFVLKVFDSRRWWPGAFFDHQRFRFSTWRHPYRQHLLNVQGYVTTFQEFVREIFPAEELFFVRPDSDIKSFKGGVKSFEEICSWVADMDAHDRLNPAEPIVIAPPVEIHEEWRLFIVDGRVSTGSRYGRRPSSWRLQPPPTDVVEFASARAAEWMPAQVFALDVARTDHGLRLVEVGCFNAAGFYSSDVQSLVRDVVMFLEKNS